MASLLLPIDVQIRSEKRKWEKKSPEERKKEYEIMKNKLDAYNAELMFNSIKRTISELIENCTKNQFHYKPLREF